MLRGRGAHGWNINKFAAHSRAGTALLVQPGPTISVGGQGEEDKSSLVNGWVVMTHYWGLKQQAIHKQENPLGFLCVWRVVVLKVSACC